MKSKIFFLILAIGFTSCLKDFEFRENERYQIQYFISKLQMPFDTLPSGVLLHKYYDGVGRLFKKNDSVTIVYSAVDIDRSQFIVKNDTFSFVVGDKNILQGWNEIVQNFAIGGRGIAIFPYYTAYGNSTTPYIQPNTTIVFEFFIYTSDYITQQYGLLYEFAHKYNYQNIIKLNDTSHFINLYKPQDYQSFQLPIEIDYQLFSLTNQLLTQQYKYILNSNDPNIPKAIYDIIPHLKQGQLVVALITPYRSFVSNLPYGLMPYTSLYAFVRISSNNPQTNQESIIQSFLIRTKSKIDKTIDNQIYSILLKNPTANIGIEENKTIKYNSQILILNTNQYIELCNECEKKVNLSNFSQWQITCLKTLKKGEKRQFIIPYEATDNPASHNTLLYTVEIIDVN